MFNKRMFNFNKFHFFLPFKKQIEEFYIRNIEFPSVFIMTVRYKNKDKIDRTLILNTSTTATTAPIFLIHRLIE